jgi:hypothetical protein
MMLVKMEEIHTVLFALHHAQAQPYISRVCTGDAKDREALRCTLASQLWELCLPCSLPDKDDPPIAESWKALLRASQNYARLADQPSGPRPPTIPDEGDAPASAMRGTA